VRRAGFSGGGQKISELPERGKKKPTQQQKPKIYKSPPLKGPAFEYLRADISRSYQSLLKTLASKPRGAGCGEVVLANNQHIGCVAERMKKEGKS